jgi:triacylglycerol esterase/lipase EstA (alpha/beta hydrolase family)
LLTLPHIGATGHRDFHPLALDTRELRVVVGYVADEFNGRAILGARVQLNGVGVPAVEDTTDSNGFFRFTGLSPTQYPDGASTLVVTHIGYKAAPPVALSSGTSPTIRLKSKTVILVHGLGGSYGGTWGNEAGVGDAGAFATALAAAGFKVVGVDAGGFPWNILPVSVAEPRMRDSLDSACHQLGIQSYDVVAHSLGGLVSRSYLTKSYGWDRIDKLVMLGTPNHGSHLATEVLGASRLLDLALNYFSGGACCGQAVSYLANQTALRDLAPGSLFLNTLNYGTESNQGSKWPCPGSFNENSAYDKATLYSIAGTHFSGWQLKAARVFLGCWGASSDGIVLKNRAFYYDDYKCTDDGLGCQVQHMKREYDGIAKSTCIAPKVVQLLLNGTFNCTATAKLDDGSVGSRLPMIHGVVQPGASFTDSTLVNAASMVDFLLISSADSLVYTLRSPSGLLIDPAYCAGDSSLEYTRGFQSAMYSVQYPEAGRWKQYVRTVGSTEPDSIQIVVAFDGAVALSAAVDSGIDPLGDFRLLASFVDAGAAIPTAAVTAEVMRPGGLVEQVDLFDDGFDADDVAGDGVYAAAYPAAGEAGSYSFVFHAVTDPQSPQAEAREARYVAIAAWLPDPAISISGLTLGAGALPLGGLLDMSASFTNLGTVAADSVAVTISNVSLGVVLVDTLLLNLGVGQTVDLPAQWLAVADGRFTLRATVELYGDGIEVSAANNAAEAAVTVYIPGAATGVPDGDDPGGDGAEATSTLVLLRDSYPNPVAAGGTSFRFTVPAEDTRTELAIFDLRGMRIRTIVNEVLPRGEHVMTWDGGDGSGRQVASGVYFYRLAVAGQVQIKKLVVLR